MVENLQITKMKNSWREIKPKSSEGTFKAVIEIPKESQNKYELNLDSGIIELEKKLKPEQTFIFDYGFIPQTLGGDNDPLDIVVLSGDKLSLGAVVNVKLIGVMRMIDEGEIDNKLIGILAGDTYWEEKINNPNVIKQEFKKIESWFEKYKKIEGTDLKIRGFDSADSAIKEIKRAIVKYDKKFRKK